MSNEVTGETPKIPNHLILSIFSLVCCCTGCFPLSIVAIYFSTQVNGLAAKGDIEGAQKASKNAKLFAIIAIVLGLIGWILSIALNGLSILSMFSR